MRLPGTILLAMSLAAVCAPGILAAAQDAIPQAGWEAPEFTLPSQDGSAVSLKNLRGKWVVLYFYPKDGTSGCTIEAHNFQRDLSGYEARNAVIMGVSLDSTGSHKEFCAKQGLTFKLLADDQKQVTPRYGSMQSILGYKLAARNTFLIDPLGTNRKGVDGRKSRGAQPRSAGGAKFPFEKVAPQPALQLY
jgi:peroxiredoxin Q/BCP